LIDALAYAATKATANIVRTLAFDSHPNSKFEYRRIMKEAQDVPVIGVISVSASGELAVRFSTVLSETVGKEFQLETLVSRNPTEPMATAIPDISVRGRQHPWLNLTQVNHMGLTGDLLLSTASECSACRRINIARLVTINPSAMGAMALGEPDRLVPDTVGAMRNKSIWERYDKIDVRATSHSGPTNTRTVEDRRTDYSNQVFFEPYLLLPSEATALLTQRYNELKAFPLRRRDDPEQRLLLGAMTALPTPTKTVVIDAAEFEQFEDGVLDDVLRGLRPYFETQSRPAVYVHKSSSESPGGVLERIDGPSEEVRGNVVLLALGLRTGVTLQRMFLTARSRWPKANVGGLVLHGHPSDRRIWDSVRNTFRDRRGNSRLLGLWLTYLPRRSPLAEEQEVLKSVSTSELDEDLIELRRERIMGRPSQILWGPQGRSLRPSSYFGEGLSERTALFAVGAAMQSARLRARERSDSAPYWSVFDLPRIFRSYFDGMIHAAILRWLRPNEAWWGQGGDECVSTLIEVRERAPDDWSILFPELLLAAAQNKVPRDGVVFLQQQVTDVANLYPDIARWVRLGNCLCDLAEPRSLVAP
jgi:hypothetical protein